ncbi:uncharacterized protein LOC132798037 [Drosophila nasuta]|uniref:uncharacterized protein LOC132798037 n=1 Tax=Drosophila nasuta TaxID=42062 RepID=UPI00295EF7C6|nr:uncharacterized protein LOC132798037 [Drosophila nasuta]
MDPVRCSIPSPGVRCRAQHHSRPVAVIVKRSAKTPKGVWGKYGGNDTGDFQVLADGCTRRTAELLTKHSDPVLEAAARRVQCCPMYRCIMATQVVHIWRNGREYVCTCILVCMYEDCTKFAGYAMDTFAACWQKNILPADDGVL